MSIHESAPGLSTVKLKVGHREGGKVCGEGTGVGREQASVERRCGASVWFGCLVVAQITTFQVPSLGDSRTELVSWRQRFASADNYDAATHPSGGSPSLWQHGQWLSLCYTRREP